jgi:hypothetical protein
MRSRGDRMLRQDGLMIAEVAVHEPLNQLVALRSTSASPTVTRCFVACPPLSSAW